MERPFAKQSTICISRRTNADAAYIECEVRGIYVLFYVMILVQTSVQVAKLLASRYYVNEISLDIELAGEGLVDILLMSTINSIHVLISYLILPLISALTFSMPRTCEFDIRPQLTISNRARRSPNSHNIRSTLHIGPVISKHGTLILHQSSCPCNRNLH